MPVVRPVAAGKRLQPKPTEKASSAANSNLYIPTEPNQPPENLHDYIVLLYGAKGIGKSSLAACNPDSLTLMLEPRRRNLRIRQIPNDQQPEPLDSWAVLKSYFDLACSDSSVQTLVIDSVDVAYSLCMEHICNELGITHPNQRSGGEGWNALAREFESTIKAVASTGKGLWLTSHARNHTVDEVVAANRFACCMPTCTPACFKFLKQICDFIFYYGYYDRKRAITVRGEGIVEAGSGLETRFLDPEGDPLYTFHVGSPAQQAYQDLLDAYDNKLFDASYQPPENAPTRLPAKIPTRPKRK